MVMLLNVVKKELKRLNSIVFIIGKLAFHGNVLVLKWTVAIRNI